MDFKRFKREYEERVEILKRLEEVALFKLDQGIKRRKVKVHSLTSRIKDLDSLLDKVKAKSLRTPFAEVRDVLGLRVVCLFRSNIELLTRIVEESFVIVGEETKENQVASDVFGYMGTYFIVRLSDDSSPQGQLHLTDLPFEIQVRTIGQDAWASLSHHLDYKGDRGVPDDFRRDFYALSGLFYVADAQFELIRTQQMKQSVRPTASDA